MLKSSLHVRRVLVVDDDLHELQTMALLLKGMGHAVEFAISGVAALDIARRFRPEVIFVDLALAGVGGIAVAQQLRREPGLQTTRIISLSGRSCEEHRQLAAEAGCTEHFRKPLDPVLLVRLLEAG